MSIEELAEAVIAQICDGVDATNKAAGRVVAEYPPTITIVDAQTGPHLFTVDRKMPTEAAADSGK